MRPYANPYNFVFGDGSVLDQAFAALIEKKASERNVEMERKLSDSHKYAAEKENTIKRLRAEIKELRGHAAIGEQVLSTIKVGDVRSRDDGRLVTVEEVRSMTALVRLVAKRKTKAYQVQISTLATWPKAEDDG